MDKNPDILKALGERKEKQFLVGFAAETQNLIANAKEKICKKNLDMIVANDVTLQGQDLTLIPISLNSCFRTAKCASWSK